MITKYLSDKLKAISFILIGMVVFLHSYNLEINFSLGTGFIGQGLNSFIQNVISQGITRIAVPLFFVISGFLFFLSIKNGSMPEFISKYRKRIKSLLLPYLFWSIFGILFFLILQLIPISKPFFTNQLIVNYSTTQLLSRIFINPFPYQLWFIKDLIVLILLSPILYWLIKYLKFYVILIFLVTWISSFNYFIFTNEALLFFALGAFFSIKNINIQNFKFNNKYLIFTALWLGLIIFKTTLVYQNFENEWLIKILHKSSILIGIVSFWLLYDKVFEKIDISKTKFYLLFQYTFFLFVFHEPLLSIFKKAFYYVLGLTELSSFIIYLSAPIITISVSILIGFYAKKTIPKLYYFATGGR